MSAPPPAASGGLAIVGPTASGKSALALGLASRLGGVEVVSVDSMQVYRGFDIGTAKPTPSERAAVAHHLLDLLDPNEECSVAWFQERSRAAVAEIVARDHRPLFVGGTGLYHRAVVDDLSIPPEAPEVRLRLDALDTDELVALMGRDKKVLGDGLTYVLDGPDGVEVVSGIDPAAVRASLARFRGEPPPGRLLKWRELRRVQQQRHSLLAGQSRQRLDRSHALRRRTRCNRPL